MGRGTQVKEKRRGEDGDEWCWVAVDGDTARHAVTRRVDGRVW